MTPFGVLIRRLRSERGMTQKNMAAALGVSAAYLSALERGKRGAPSFLLVQKVIQLFELIWEDAEQVELAAKLSRPRLTIDLADASPSAVELLNKLEYGLARMSEERLRALIALVEKEDNH